MNQIDTPGGIYKDCFLTKIIGKDCYVINRFTKNITFSPDSFYTYITPYDIHKIRLCNKNQMIYISSRVTLQMSNKREGLPVQDKAFTIDTVSHDKDWSRIYDITQIILQTSRFYKDWYVKKYANAIYKQWINNSILNNYADKYYFIRFKGEVVGYATLKNNTIDLIGIKKEFQQQGVGSMLIQYLVKIYGFDLRVGTESENIPALSFYLKNGFQLQSYSLIYHKHT